MKKVILTAIIALSSFCYVNAQKANFGVTAGFHNFTVKNNGQGITASTSASGFFVGVTGDFQVSDDFNIQPELHFVSTSKNGESVEQIVMPIMGKYYITGQFNLQAGPQIDLVISESDGLNTLGIGLGFGAGYDFSDKLFATARYSFGLSNRVEDAPSGVSLKFDTFQIGVGYKF
jgi:opacity protein-like surface antigen